jgi:hypothetical protein
MKAHRFGVGTLLFSLVLALSLLASGRARADADDDLKQRIVGAWAPPSHCQDGGVIQFAADGRVGDWGKYVMLSGWLALVVKDRRDPKAHPDTLYFHLDGDSLIGIDRDHGPASLARCPG